MLVSPDSTPPTASFSPADEATGVAIDANIILYFNESIKRGAGSISLKTSLGSVIATYDAATSSNLSISGSTLTINPTADLSYSTGYKVEFAAGSIKDLAGNNFAGTTDYNFTTKDIKKAVFWNNNSLNPTQDKKIPAVNLTDAINILKMIVGLSININNSPVKSYQSLAADFDQDGSVGLTDAIGVLKMIVGLSAPTPAWRYFEDAKLKSNLSSNETLNPKIWIGVSEITDPSTAGDSVKVVGVLAGDVDGSWTGT
jgi:hypothetical protein